MASKHWKQTVLERTPSRMHPVLQGVYQAAFPSVTGQPKRDVSETLSSEYVENAEVLVDRTSLLERLPADGLVAELGVDYGAFSEQILSVTNPRRLFLVDIWGSERYGETKLNHVRDEFRNDDRVRIERKRSDEFLRDFPDDTLDWVYIDTTHAYEQTKLELELSREKVKDDGIIAGHDYSVGTPHRGVSYGVIEAVHEFCETYDWELRYLTVETSGNSSFALQKRE